MGAITLGCGFCGKPLNPKESDCPVCGGHNDPPNVRQAREPAEISSLQARVHLARQASATAGLSGELAKLEAAVDASQPVMTRSHIDLLKLLDSASNFYVGFSRQVEAGMRLPNGSAIDEQRLQWENAIFPNYSEMMLFGSLSVSERGLGNYGDAHIILVEAFIKNRATVFECNGMVYAEDNHITLAQSMPTGLRASWPERARLAVAKLYSKLVAGITDQQIDKIVQFDAGGGFGDDFIELHIYGGINRDCFEKVVSAPDPSDPDAVALWGVAVNKMTKLGIKTETR